MNIINPLFGAALLSSLVVPTAQECKEAYKKQPTHTACKSPNTNCKIFKKQLSDADRELVLKVHNDYRSQVAKGELKGFPPAKDMVELQWDDELADVAQALAEQCTNAAGTLNHDDTADRFTTKFEKTGQNLAWDASSAPVEGAQWAKHIKEWFDEYPKIDASSVKQFSGSAIMAGHFTQVVWAKSVLVGCGFVYYNVTGAQWPHMRLYACNYGPTGNVLRKPMYDEGKACDACPADTKCAGETGLCSSSTGGKTDSKNTDPNGSGDKTSTKPISHNPAEKGRSGSTIVCTLCWLNPCAVSFAIAANFYFGVMQCA